VTAQPKNMSLVAVSKISIPKKIRKFRHKNTSREDQSALCLLIGLRAAETSKTEAVGYYAYKFGLAKVTIWKILQRNQKAAMADVREEVAV
jgi:hypothetical protein